jgi:hypothetical protein
MRDNKWILTQRVKSYKFLQIKISVATDGSETKQKRVTEYGLYTFCKTPEKTFLKYIYTARELWKYLKQAVLQSWHERKVQTKFYNYKRTGADLKVQNLTKWDRLNLYK